MVHGRKRVPGYAVEVGVMAVVQAELSHRLAEQAGMEPLGTAAAELVGLDLRQRDLRPSVEARDRQRVWLILLELIGRAVDEELTELVDAGGALQVPRQRRAVGSAEDLGEPLGNCARVHALEGHRLPQRGFEPPLEAPPERQQGGFPFPLVVDLGKAAVVQFVEHVEREVQVLAAQRVVGRQRDGAELVRDLPEGAQHALRQRPAGVRQAGAKAVTGRRVGHRHVSGSP
jgi:hypothetical protein